MDDLDGMYHVMWCWSQTPPARSHGSTSRRRSVPARDGDRNVQRRSVPKALPGLCLCSMDRMYQVVWHRRTVALAVYHGPCARRRLRVPVSAGDACVQHAHVCCGLRGQCVAQLEHLYEVLWRWFAASQSHVGAARGRWQGMPAQCGDSCVQHASMRRCMHNARMATVELVHEVLWTWNAAP